MNIDKSKQIKIFAVDHINNIMYVSSNNIPWETYVEKMDIFNMRLKIYPISEPPWWIIYFLRKKFINLILEENRGKCSKKIFIDRSDSN